MKISRQTPIRYQRHKDELRLDIDAAKLVVGEYLMLECYGVIDPDTYTDVWSDWWLQGYAIQLIKRQWGTNLSKFEGMQLPGGITFNGSKIYDDADGEVKRMEEEMINKYSLPVADMVG